MRIINSVHAGTETITADDLELLKKTFGEFVFDILGLREEIVSTHSDTEGLMQFILKLRAEAKARKDFATSDEIRDELSKLGFSIKDTKEGVTYSRN